MASTEQNKLTIKQDKFCLEYMKDGNAARSYRESYSASKMSEASMKSWKAALVTWSKNDVKHKSNYPPPKKSNIDVSMETYERAQELKRKHNFIEGEIA